MTIDAGLLDKARTAGERCAEAERQALLTRADYHAAIRRVHLAGGSLREIAQVLSLSYQRVQQIVSAAGGSWWMSWRSRQAPRDPICTWCGRSPAEVAKLIAGPKVFICDACVDVAERRVTGESPAVARGSGVRPRGGSRCAFCGKRASERRKVVTGASNICSECLAVCQDILDGSAR